MIRFIKLSVNEFRENIKISNSAGQVASKTVIQTIT